MRGERRKIAMNRLVRNEKGYILILALLVLVVVGLISGPVLSYMVSGLRAGHVFETGAAELYAADSGVTYALWKIKEGNLCPGVLPKDYNINVNGKDVEVNIEIENEAYKITSEATAGDNSHTTAVAYVDVTTQIGPDFFDNAITSLGDVSIASGCAVNGNVTYGGDLAGGDNINGTATPGTYQNWPECGNLSDHYLSQVQGAPDPGSPIDVGTDTVTKGPCKRNGDLHITGRGGTLKLTGTIYVTGSLYCDQSGQGYTIDLNDQTIFVGGLADFPANHVTIKGSGCIIACQNVNFQPGIMSNSNDFVFVLSIAGNVNFQPNGNFYGSVAGNVEVNLQPGNTLTWHSLGETSLNFPIDQYSGVTTVTAATITSYDVSRQ
jgi:hypothetical protein